MATSCGGCIGADTGHQIRLAVERESSDKYSQGLIRRGRADPLDVASEDLRIGQGTRGEPYHVEGLDLHQLNDLIDFTALPTPYAPPPLSSAAARAALRHVAGSEWSTKRYLSMELLKGQQGETASA